MRLIRRLRRVAFYGLLAPVVITAALVGLNKVTDGAMAIFVNGDPWTHYFWNTLFGAMIVGIVALFLAKAVVCPNCGNGFHVMAGFDPRGPEEDNPSGSRINVFSRRCVNCRHPLHD